MLRSPLLIRGSLGCREMLFRLRKVNAVGELSVHFCEQSVDLAEDGKLLGKIPLQALHGDGLTAFKRENQLRMGTVYYQSWLSGVMSGVVLLFGPPELVEVPVESPAENGTPVPITVDGLLPGEPVATEDSAATTVAAPSAAETLPEDPGGVLAISPELHAAAAATVADPASSAPTP